MIKVYNRDGNVSGEMEFPKHLTVKWNPVLVYQVMRSMQANRRQVIADTKDRGEVRGGGKKPWNQKGTGRARHGSIRSPIWRGGGTTFGPTSDRNFSQKINKKMLVHALRSVLAKKAEDGELKAVESLDLGSNKTKAFARMLRPMIQTHSAILVAPHANKAAHQGARNLANVDVLRPEQLNVYDLLNHREVVIEKNLFETYGK